MDKFPRGSLPPSAYVPIVKQKHDEVEPPPTTIDHAKETAKTPRGTCDLASTCPNCNTVMEPEHAHYRCATCGYRDSCCF